MKFLCLIYQSESAVRNFSKAEFEKIHGEYVTLHRELEESGRLLGNHGLQPAENAKTVRVRDGKVMATDGPFAETKEQLGGYFLVEANDLDDAIQIAVRIPSARFGSIEVRPVREW